MSTASRRTSSNRDLYAVAPPCSVKGMTEGLALSPRATVPQAETLPSVVQVDAQPRLRSMLVPGLRRVGDHLPLHAPLGTVVCV